ncbi:MAG: dihydroorotase [Flaviaesturariibacter sp.]|nr:dihydroorotase [Flaviaesturariibacter sp.]
MDILIRQPLLIDPSSPFHLQKADLFISNGIIRQIGGELPSKYDLFIDEPGLCVSPGWVDIFANFCDPGQEFKETLETGANAAAAGGYTDVFLVPNTTPVVHSKAPVEYLVQKSYSLPVNLHPIGAVTKNAEGQALSEMYDMQASGAIAFSDGTASIQSAGLLLKALEYLKAIDRTIIQLPDNRSINPGGLMNEGIVSTRLGLPGRPAIAEELMIARDIELAKYTGSKLHFTGVTTAKSIQLIQEAKATGLPISCSVTPYHLFFCDEDLQDYDTYLKVNPPLRSAADRTALQEAVMNGTIDCIASHHLPQDTDAKIIEFEYAQYGMIGLQTAFATVKTALPKITEERLVELFCTTPRRLFDLPPLTITEGASATLTLFQPNTPWTFEKEHNRSRSANSPFFSRPVTGKPLGIIAKGGVFLNTY